MNEFTFLLKGKYTVNDINVRYEKEKFKIPKEAQLIKNKIIGEKQKEAEQKDQEFYENSLLRMKSLSQNPIVIETQPTSWFDFISTNRSMNDVKINETVMKKLCTIDDLGNILANPITVTVLFISADKKMIITKRSNSVFQYPGCWTASVAGFVEIGDKINNVPNPFATVVREVKEETGVTIVPKDYELLGIGRPSDFFHIQWIGRVFLNKNSQEIINHFKKSDEISEVVCVPFIKDEFNEFSRNKSWVPAGFACIYRSLEESL